MRELLSLPRNLRGDAEATAKFEAVFAHLDPDGNPKPPPKPSTLSCIADRLAF